MPAWPRWPACWVAPSPEEARFVARIASREMRIGLREGLLEEAIAAAFERPIADVRRALMLVGEPGEAAALARDDALGSAALHLGRPIRFMLATPVADSDEVMRRVGDEAWIEDKYDGIRAQLHLDGEPRLFSRDQNDITVSFPEVAARGQGPWPSAGDRRRAGPVPSRDRSWTSPACRPGWDG